jgi:hypothetical protein
VFGVVDKVGEVTMAANQFLQWAGAWHGFRFGFRFLL